MTMAGKVYSFLLTLSVFFIVLCKQQICDGHMTSNSRSTSRNHFGRQLLFQRRIDGIDAEQFGEERSWNRAQSLRVFSSSSGGGSASRDRGKIKRTVESSNYCSTRTSATSSTSNQVFNASCMLCSVSLELTESGCPPSSHVVGEAIRGCDYGMFSPVFDIPGCSSSCRRTVDEEEDCCAGHWGPFCTECPGGAANACFSHGRCNDGMEGTGHCTCHEGYTGEACESCVGDSCPVRPSCMLESNTGCHTDALCQQDSTGTSSCQCLDGYYGDGVTCLPVNPCFRNFGECPTNSSVCVQDGLTQYHCECKPGFTSYRPGIGCVEIDACQSLPCPIGAECVVQDQGRGECQCTQGYMGNGQVCYGNIIQRLEKLNVEDESLHGRLSEALLLFQTSLIQRLLRDRDIFSTVFVPSDEALQQANSEFTAQLDTSLGYDDPADVFLERLARMHIVPGYIDTYMMGNTTTLYSLTGQRIHIGQDLLTLTVGVEGCTEVAHIVHSDLSASNGVIHIINKVLVPSSPVQNRIQDTMMDVLLAYPELTTIRGLIQSSEFGRLLADGAPTTIFAFTDSAWQTVSPQVLSQIVSSGLWEEFVSQLLNDHVLRAKLSVHDLMKAGEVENSQGKTWMIRVSDNGQIGLSGIANITVPDVRTSHGMIHVIDSLLYPASYFALPETCYSDQTSEEGLPECCDGFYSSYCVPCSAECDHGVCDSGREGSGHCICDAGFRGPHCQFCQRPLFFGPHCNTTCSCLHGSCDHGPRGSGRCLPGSCYEGFMGEDCDIITIPCGPQELQCHAHAQCVMDEGLQRCVCSSGYEGSGEECIANNPCLTAGTALCEPSAECVHTGPGRHRCQCLSGEEGDRGCTPEDRCLINNGGCHQNATCIHRFIPDLINCVCMDGFEGNGYSCEPINACLKKHNCDVRAQCVATGPGLHDCLCPPGWGSDEGRCFSNLAVELSALPEGESFWRMIQAINLDGYVGHTNYSLGVIVPQALLLQQLSNLTGDALEARYIMEYFMRSHMFMLPDVRHQLTINATFPSLQPGETVHLSGIHGTLSVVNGEVAQVRKALNGLIFLPITYPMAYWVKRLGLIQGKLDLVATTSGDVQDYSQAWAEIQASELLPSDPEMPFTVFLPDNKAISILNSTTLARFLQNHIITGQVLYHQNLTDLQNSTSGAELDSYLQMVVTNLVPIEAPDILILPNGVAHGISRIITPAPLDGHCDDGQNGGCHVRATCIQESSTQLYCVCSDGYHGDGLQCIPTDPCIHDNGGCHFRADCIPIGPHERTCSCALGYSGDGVTCFGTVYEELKSIPETSNFVQFIDKLNSDSVLRGEGQFTVFVPSNLTLESFIISQGLEGNQMDGQYMYYLTQFVLYHMVSGSRLMSHDLRNLSSVGVMNGQDLSISTEGDSIILQDDVVVTSPDHQASNGIIHILDGWLTPERIYSWPAAEVWDFESPVWRPFDPEEFVEALARSHNISVFLELLRRTPLGMKLFMAGSGMMGGPGMMGGHGGGPPHPPPPGRPVWMEGGEHRGAPGQGFNASSVRHGAPDFRHGRTWNASTGSQRRLTDRRRPMGRGRRTLGFRQELNPAHRDDIPMDEDAMFHTEFRAAHHRRSVRPDYHSHRDRPSPPHHFGPRSPHDEHRVTVFAPTDEAFQRLPPGILQKLLAPEHSMLLQEFIAHHVLVEERYFDDLWPAYTGPTLQGSDLRLGIMGQGQLYVNERSRVMGVGLELEGGIIYPVSEIISLPEMAGRCDHITTHTRMSRCRQCGSPLCPPHAEQMGEEEQGCRYRVGWYNSKIGCQATCQFTEVTKACCEGYYGSSCQECPGGATLPCTNHGQCEDGFHSNGSCSCRVGFEGTACERCSSGYYGPACRKCRCANSSVCLSQTGECFCDEDTYGLYCQHSLPSRPTCAPPCHQDAVCRPDNICQCLPQFIGNGYTCDAVNHCFSRNGGCSVHATCRQELGSSQVNCTCHDGYHGDGVVCTPINLCELNNGGCHANATCQFKGPKVRTCLCRPPFWGNGIECQAPITSCLVQNGGCSPNALCQEGENGDPRQCTCEPGYVGDGLQCNGNMYDTIASQPDFSQFYQMLTQFANLSREGQELSEDLLNPNYGLTVFIPLLLQNDSGLTYLPSQVLLHVVRGSWSRMDLLGQDQPLDQDQELILRTWSRDKLHVRVFHNDYHQDVVTIEGVEVLTFDIETTNGLIHIIREPLPIWRMVDYDDDDDDDESHEGGAREASWSSASRIFAAVAVPLAALGFLAIVLYWFREKRSRELVGDTHQGPRNDATSPQWSELIAATRTGSEEGVAPSSSHPEPASPSPPASPMDQGVLFSTECDHLMSEETGERMEHTRDTKC